MENTVHEGGLWLAVDHVTNIPGWSLVAQLVLGVVAVVLQWSVREHKRFSDWNEFICTFLWVTLTLEATVIGLSSSNHALFNLFLRMLVWPLLSLDAAVNPLNSIYATTLGIRSSQHVARQILIQLVAMATGMVYILASWRLLAAWFSDSHLGVMSSHVNPFLTVGLITGFLLEMGMSFAMYIPRLVMGLGFKSNFVSAVLVCAMILYFENMTGAFMNPIVALSMSLLWHHGSYSTAAVFEMAFVYWLGPIVGTYLIAQLDKWIASRRKLHLS